MDTLIRSFIANFCRYLFSLAAQKMDVSHSMNIERREYFESKQQSLSDPDGRLWSGTICDEYRPGYPAKHILPFRIVDRPVFTAYFNVYTD